MRFFWWLLARYQLRDAKGATTTEYALVLALVVVILIGTLNELGTTLKMKLQEIIYSLDSAGGK